MANVVCDVVGELSTVSSTTFIRLSTVLDEAGAASDLSTYGLRTQLTDTGALAETATPVPLLLPISTGVLADVSTPTDIMRVTVVETFVARDSLDVYASALATDSGVLADQSTPTTYFAFVSTGILAESSTPIVVARAVAYDAGGLASDVFDTKTLVATDTGVLADAATPSVPSVALLVDAGVLSDTSSPAVPAIVFATSTLAATTTVSARTTARVVVYETADLDANAFDDYGGAWTANTDTWAASRYGPFDFRSIAALQGEVYATNRFGLVQFGAGNDNGTAIQASIYGGLTDFDSEQLKLAKNLYLGYLSETPLSVTMGTTYEGSETAYTYAAPARSAQSWVPGRVSLGRGLRSRYMRVTIQNTNGGDFHIDKATIDVDVSARRV